MASIAPKVTSWDFLTEKYDRETLANMAIEKMDSMQMKRLCDDDAILYDDCIESATLLERAINAYEKSLSELNSLSESNTPSELFKRVTQVSSELKSLSMLYVRVAVVSGIAFFEISPESLAERQKLALKSLSFFEKAFELLAGEELLYLNRDAALRYLGMLTAFSVATTREESLLKQFLDKSNLITPRSLPDYSFRNITFVHTDTKVEITKLNEVFNRTGGSNVRALMNAMPYRDRKVQLESNINVLEKRMQERQEIGKHLSERHIYTLTCAYAIRAYFEPNDTEREDLFKKLNKVQWMNNRPIPFGQSLKNCILAKQRLDDIQFSFN